MSKAYKLFATRLAGSELNLTIFGEKVDNVKLIDSITYHVTLFQVFRLFYDYYVKSEILRVLMDLNIMQS